MVNSLFEKLKAYVKEDYYPMHMPGHKRNKAMLNNSLPYEIDITEIDGFDNLHHPEEIILELMQRVEALYHSEKSYLLVNGSTVGILAGISAAVKKKDTILMARNCHKSVYHAVILNELNPIYIYPQYEDTYGIAGGISPERIEEMLISHPEIKLVVVTSPTYEGLISDIHSISEICHRHQVPLMVDEAHGAHLGFDESFPNGSISCGADLVIHSIHKTLPAFTQTAIMHVNGKLISKERVEQFLGMYETSSPSYVLLAGIDQCISLLEPKKQELFKTYKKRLRYFYERTADFKHLSVMRPERYQDSNQKKHGIYAMDPSKILISVKNTNITGRELALRLQKEFRIQLEMSSFTYGLAMTSICDTEDGIQRLIDALHEIDQTLEDGKKETYEISEFLERSYLPAEAFYMEQRKVELFQAKDLIAGENIMIYPPGVPIVVAGEKITDSIISTIKEAMAEGLEVLGIHEDEKGNVCCIVVIG